MDGPSTQRLAREAIGVADDDLVELRSGHLPPADGDLLRAAWIYRQPADQLARLTGLSVRQVRYRVNRLVRRVHSPEFLAAIRSMPLLTPAQATIARLHVCGDMGLRAIAGELRLPYHQVRRIATEVRAVLTGLVRMSHLAARRSARRGDRSHDQPDGTDEMAPWPCPPTDGRACPPRPAHVRPKGVSP